MTDEVFISEPLPRRPGSTRYLVTHARAGSLRLFRCTDLQLAVVVRDEWRNGNFALAPGETRALPTPSKRT